MKMAVPKRKTSKQRKRKRRTHYKLEVPGMVAYQTVVNTVSHIISAQAAVFMMVKM